MPFSLSVWLQHFWDKSVSWGPESKTSTLPSPARLTPLPGAFSLQLTSPFHFWCLKGCQKQGEKKLNPFEGSQGFSNFSFSYRSFPETCHQVGRSSHPRTTFSKEGVEFSYLFNPWAISNLNFCRGNHSTECVTRLLLPLKIYITIHITCCAFLTIFCIP